MAAARTATRRTKDAAPPPDPQRIVWGAQDGPQQALLACPVEDVFFGGARGGGKTDGLIGDWLQHADLYGRYARGLLLRRTLPELSRVIERGQEIMPRLGWVFKESKKLWRHRSGATLRLGYLERDKDAERYQGHEYTWIGVDELPQFPNPEPIDKLRACLRSTAPGVPKVFRASGNPGGAGHNWVKARYITPGGKKGMRAFFAPNAKGTGGTWRVYIPATVDDNPALMQADPEYWQRIVAAVGNNRALLHAWRYGEWDIVAGGFFDDIWNAMVTLPDGRVVPANRIFVIPTFPVPGSWTITRSFDNGSTRPFSVGWWAISDGTPAIIQGRVVHFARGTMIRVGEYYGWDGRNPNTGVGWTVPRIAAKVREIEAARGWSERVVPGPADPSIFATYNGVNVGREFATCGVQWTAGEAKAGSRANGWAMMRQMLEAATQWPMERPGMFICDVCEQFIRTVPTLPRDVRKPEDVDTNAEDHIADEARYMVLAQVGGVQRLSNAGF
jgi:hypothetical protein